MDWWNLRIPAPVALAAVATIGYLVSRQRRMIQSDIVIRSRRELKRAKAVATELEKIAWSVRQSLAKHHSSVSRFKQRINQLNESQLDTTWKDLCREAEEILKPTLQLSTQIANAYDEIRQQSSNLMAFTEVRTDPMTGVNNRRGLDDALNTQFAMMTRYHMPFSVVMFDIDHFKQVNDQLGHLHGDRTLQELARLFDDSIRETDILARYGGEEFMIVMPHTELGGASVIAERLRALVDAQMAVTISGGVAEAREDDTQESLISRADAALYTAKSGGRNLVYRNAGNNSEAIPAETVLTG